MRITVSSPVNNSPRVEQVRGVFDLAPAKTSTLTWDVNLPLSDRSWRIGLITGPSGCGKSTIARHLWPFTPPPAWRPDESILDGFPDLPIKEITELLSSVGLSSPPAWLRPFHVLSTGQQFRVTMARLIAEDIHRYTVPLAGTKKESLHHHAPIVVDEFTSVVDRNVAKIGSAAIAKTIRKRGRQFVAVSCHDDIEEWLCPDWTYRPAEQSFAWRSLRRPTIDLKTVRCYASAWPLFAPHHYLSGELLKSAWCFLTSWRSCPVAFSAWLPFVGAGPPTRREHRTVTLPDFQGVGIGNHVSALIASMWKGLGYRAISTTTHPAMMRARCASPLWNMHREPSFGGITDKIKHASARLTAGFEYIGPAMPTLQAKALLCSE